MVNLNTLKEAANGTSSLVGEQKLRKQKDGTVREYVYYHCSRQVDRGCKELFARESDIIDQLYDMRHKLIPNKDILEPGFKKAIEKTSAIAGSTFDEAFNIYAKYVLYKGTKFEQTRFVGNISVDLQLHNRKVILSAQLPDQVTQ